MSRWIDVPFSPKSFPFFYGWVIVFGSVLAMIASVPGQTFGVGVFKEPLLAAWGMSSMQLSVAYMAGTVLSGFSLPLAGSLLDRFGLRAGMVVSCVGIGASMGLLAESDRLGQRISTSGAWGVVCMTLCFFLIRFFGQGCLGMVARLAIGKWFHHRRGLATALSGTPSAFAFNLSPMVLGAMISGYGWRSAAWMLAGVIGVMLAGIGWILFRDTPEECGLQMDGGVIAGKDEGAAAAVFAMHEFTRVEALRTAAFWVYSLALGAHGLMITALAFHIESIGGYHGLSSEEAFQLFWPMALISIPCTILMSWLSDRVDMRVLLMAFCISQLVGNTGLYFLSDGWARIFLFGGYGLANGLFGALLTVAFPRFFGRLHLGAISGANMAIMVFATALGPVLFSEVERLTGDYQVAIAWYSAVPILLLLLGLGARDPQRTRARRAP